MKGIMRGKCFKFGDNIDTDMIIPVKYCNTYDMAELGKHCMAGYEENFAKNISTGDFLVAGSNFGCGSSRENAPLAIKGCGIQAVIASSFARIFLRNAINVGLLIFESEEASQKISEGDQLEIIKEKGLIRNLTRVETYSSSPLPEFITTIIEEGGLVGYVRKKLKGKQEDCLS
ncbi:MAG: 3-isopropylmalate dehydratase small subunit [Acidobacteriota bacterium]